MGECDAFNAAVSKGSLPKASDARTSCILSSKDDFFSAFSLRIVLVSSTSRSSVCSCTVRPKFSDSRVGSFDAKSTLCKFDTVHLGFSSNRWGSVSEQVSVVASFERALCSSRVGDVALSFAQPGSFVCKLVSMAPFSAKGSALVGLASEIRVSSSG